jgi:hypothetical protein
MKQYLLSIIFLFSLACNVGFGQDCVDLTQYQKELDEAIDIISPNDTTLNKTRLTQIKGLLKPCTEKDDFVSIRNIYFKMDNSIPFKATLLTLLKNNNSLCVNITESKINPENPILFKQILDSLINVNEEEIDDGISGFSKKENLQHFKAMRNLLSDCTNLTELEQLQILNEKINTKGFGDFTGNFVSNFREALSTNISLLNALPQENISKNNLESNKDENIDEEESSNLWKYILYTLLGLALITGAAYGSSEIYRILKRKDKQDAINKTPSKNNGESMLRTQRNEKLEKENKDLKKENREIERNLNNAKGEIQNLKQEIKEMEQADKTVPATKTTPVRKQDKQKGNTSNRNDYEKVLFFASPTSNGEFLAKNGQSEVKSGASIYIFYVNGSEATFEFYNDPSTFQATINDPGNRIKPVCDANNAYNPDAKKITTKREERGKATLQNDKWKVTKKAKISYEA